MSSKERERAAILRILAAQQTRFHRVAKWVVSKAKRKGIPLAPLRDGQECGVEDSLVVVKHFKRMGGGCIASIYCCSNCHHGWEVGAYFERTGLILENKNVMCRFETTPQERPKGEGAGVLIPLGFCPEKDEPFWYMAGDPQERNHPRFHGHNEPQRKLEEKRRILGPFVPEKVNAEEKKKAIAEMRNEGFDIPRDDQVQWDGLFNANGQVIQLGADIQAGILAQPGQVQLLMPPQNPPRRA